MNNLATLRSLLAILSVTGRKKLVRLTLLILLGSGVQLVGIASVLPFIALVSDPEIIHQTGWAHQAYEFFRVGSINSFLILLGALMLLSIAVSNLFSAYALWATLHFTSEQEHELSVRLLARYLANPYAWYLNKSTPSLKKAVLGDVSELVGGILMPLTQIVSRSSLAVLIVALLMIVNVQVALTSLLVLGGAYAALYLMSRSRFSLLAEQRYQAIVTKYLSADDVLNGIKEAKLLHSERHFLREFRGASERASEIATLQISWRELPRFALETLTFGGVIVLILSMLSLGQDVRAILPTLTLYTFAGYRLMPALQQISSSLAQMRAFLPILARVSADLEGAPDLLANGISEDVDITTPLSLCDKIEVSALSYCYPDTDEPVLREIELAIKKGASIGLVGGSGAGKTTLVDLILGLLEPTAGEIRVDGQKLDSDLRPRWQRSLGYVSQSIYLRDDSLRSNIAYGVTESEIDDVAVERAARIAEVHDFAKNLPEGYLSRVGDRGVRLSGGQRQRIGIARALYRDPTVLILDEATSALDGITEAAVMDAIKNLQKTLILIAHRLTTVQSCDVIYRMSRGTIVNRGTYQQLLETDEVFRAMARLQADAPC